MPAFNGFETAALIYEREKLRHIPIIFITANNYGEENIFKGYRSGAVDYIYKPINPELLRAKVSVFVELYNKNRQLQAQEKKLIAVNVNLQNEILDREASEKKVRELNEELINNISRLEAANQELDRFAFMASHDLREPLRKIRTFCDLVYTRNENILDENGKSQLMKIQKSAARMQVLIEDILNFSRISSAREPFVKCDLDKLMKDVVVDLEENIEDKKAQIQIDKLPSIMGNERLLLLLFNNIISNAIKYSKKNIPPVIRISCEINKNLHPKHDSLSDRYCRIFIEDNGIGFEPQYAEYIFGMFKRLHHHTEFEGTGIGLSLCRKITELHRGFIAAKSKLNKGSVFIISLPMKNTEQKISVN